jgi:hypothetical protein
MYITTADGIDSEMRSHVERVVDLVEGVLAIPNTPQKRLSETGLAAHTSIDELDRFRYISLEFLELSRPRFGVKYPIALVTIELVRQ